MIKRFRIFVNESFVNPVKSDMKKFDGKLRHKLLYSGSGSTYNAYIATDEDTSLRVTRLYVGKHALDLGGYAPSYNDVWLQKDDCVVVIKTNGDDLVPDDVIISAADIVRRKCETHKEERDSVRMALSKYVKVVGGDILVDEVNIGEVLFTPGNAKVIR